MILFSLDQLMPFPFTGSKMFCGSPNFLSQPKNLTAFNASSKFFVLTQKQFYCIQIIFLCGTRCLWLPQYVNKFLVWYKTFGPSQNILGPVTVQGISEHQNMPEIEIVFFFTNNSHQILKKESFLFITNCRTHWKFNLFFSHSCQSY